MTHEPFAFPPASKAVSEERPRALDHSAALCATILEQDRIIGREIQDVLGCRLEFNILLALYVAEHRGSAPCLWDIGTATSAPSSTAHRKIAGLIHSGLLQRLPPSGDRRRVAVQLSADARTLVERTLEHLVERAI